MRHAAMRHAAMRGVAVRPGPVGHAAIWVPAVRPAGAPRSARHRTVGARVTGHAASARSAVRRSGAGGTTPGGTAPGGTAPGGTAPGGNRGGWPGCGRPGWRSRTPPGRHLARSARQLSVIVFLGVYRSARPGRIVLLGGGWVAVIGRVGSKAPAIPVAHGDTVRVTAEAGVATFHQIPPGPWCPAAPRDICPYLLSVGCRESPV